MADLNTLLAQRAELEAQIAAAKPEAVAAVRALMAQLGVTTADLTAGQRTTSKRPVKFADGAGNTWTGVGQRPRWLVARLVAGATLDEFRVK